MRFYYDLTTESVIISKKIINAGTIDEIIKQVSLNVVFFFLLLLLQNVKRNRS